VIGYLRVSTEEQGESGLGLEAQRRAIEAECERRGWELVAVREEVKSGARAENRPVLRDALAQLRRREANAIVVAKLDRLARSVADFCDLAKRGERQGWAIVVLDPALDMTTPMGMAFAQMLAVFAELERRMIGQRTSAALRVKMARGWKPHRPAPIIPEEVRQKIVRLHHAGMSRRRIAEELNREGVPAIGQRWHPETIGRVLRAAESA
jgi:DNA invertase Pin-like site-specific DNA recombinase